MLARSIVLATLVLFGPSFLGAALADEPGHEATRLRRFLGAKPFAVRSPAARAYAPAGALVTTVPPCEDVTTLLLSCVPRRPFPTDWPAGPVIAEIATASPPYARPYRQLFSWD